MCNLTVTVPDHCRFIYFSELLFSVQYHHTTLQAAVTLNLDPVEN